MRKKPLILVAFLMLSLCMIPSVTAGYGDESPQSITSFSETLPDDVMFYPDAFGNGAIELADYGEDQNEDYDPNYVKTQALDDDAFEEVGVDIEIWFEVDTTTGGFNGFEYSHYLYATSQTDCDLTAYNFDTDLFVKIDEPLPESYDWMNGTISDPDYWNTTHIAFQLFENTGDADFFWDYGQISISYMTLTDSDHYAESFADVSDWTYNLSSGAGDYNFTSDGDVATMEKDLESTSTEYVGYTTEGTWSGTDYFEMRWMCNGKSRVHAQIWDGSEWDILINYERSIVDYVTTKIYLGSYGSSFTVLRLLVDDYSNAYNSDSLGFMLDYLQIGPANESGWQHDGSTTQGVSDEGSVGWTFGTSSDNDVLTFDWERTGGADTAAWQQINFDTTTTSAEIDLDLYPFWALHWRVTEATNASLKFIQVYTDDTRVALTNVTATDETTIWATMRHNMRASTDTGIGGNSFRFYVANTEDTATFTLEIEYLKFYSIANWKYYDASATTTDICYVDVSNGLVFDKTSTAYVRWTYDLPLSVDTVIFNILSVTTGSWTGSGDYSYGTDYDIGSGWVGYELDETRYSLTSGTLEALRIIVRDSGTISAITFIDDHTWRGFTTVTVWFEVIAFEGTLGMLLIFGGLILIPASTLYAVKGGREEMNTDKLFYVLIAFVMGWALVIGGIYA